mgnify:CR=1 FL=1
MNWSVLRTLLGKYYGGVSSREEEKQMLDLLNQEDLPGEFYEDKILITGMHAGEEIPEPSTDLDKRILSAINKSEKEKRIIHGSRRLYSFVSVAASIIIIIGFWFIFDKKNHLKDTYQDPQLAYNETIEVLYRVSFNLNKGRDQINELSLIGETRSKLGLITDSRETIRQELNALKYIESSIEMLDLTNNK